MINQAYDSSLLSVLLVIRLAMCYAYADPDQTFVSMYGTPVPEYWLSIKYFTTICYPLHVPSSGTFNASSSNVGSERTC
jgi:hypothetical protein